MSSARVTRRKVGYSNWCLMRQRCNDPKCPAYADYGGRGIRVWSAWDRPGGSDTFLADVGPRPSAQHSLERLDVNGHYEPGNVVWATTHEQSRNKRTNRLVTFHGRTQTVADWASETGQSYHQLYLRLFRRGWSVSRALREM
jgi:hypothetical protein